MRHLFAAALVLSIATSARAERPKIAVVDLVDKGVGKDLAQNLTDVATVALNKLGVFDVLSRADIQQMIAFEQEKQMVGCESDTSCLAEIGGALGVALLVSGSIGKVGNSYIINLVLTDTRSATVNAREQRQVAGADTLTQEVEGAARFLVRSLLAGQQGFLVVKSTESGADVEVDGRIVGVTPLGRQELSGGPHVVKLIKTGFITWARDVDVKKDDTTVVNADMVPSLEFINEYDGRASTWRIASYLTGGLGIAAAAFGVVGYFVIGASNEKQFNDDVARDGCQEGGVPAPGVECGKYEDERSSIESFDTLSMVIGWVGVAAIAAGVILFIQGPEPGIYDQYKTSTQAPASAKFDFGVMPTEGGMAASARLTF